MKRLISLCIMVAPFPAGDVSTCNGTSADSVDAIGLGAVFVLVDELEVALWLAHVSPRMSSSVCQCCLRLDDRVAMPPLPRPYILGSTSLRIAVG